MSSNRIEDTETLSLSSNDTWMGVVRKPRDSRSYQSNYMENRNN